MMRTPTPRDDEAESRWSGSELRRREPYPGPPELTASAPATSSPLPWSSGLPCPPFPTVTSDELHHHFARPWCTATLDNARPNTAGALPVQWWRRYGRLLVLGWERRALGSRRSTQGGRGWHAGGSGCLRGTRGPD
eukprot:93740-Rhodomonas_salina.1